MAEITNLIKDSITSPFPSETICHAERISHAALASTCGATRPMIDRGIILAREMNNAPGPQGFEDRAKVPAVRR
jgi:hypothetical protein